MSRIYWDSVLFMYWLEENPHFIERMGVIRSAMLEQADTLCTSIFTLGEVLTGPYSTGAMEVASRIKEVLRAPAIELIPFTVETADRYARIRGQNKLQSADAIHLASAAQAGVDLFLTNDRRLQKLKIAGIDFIAGLDVNLF